MKTLLLLTGAIVAANINAQNGLSDLNFETWTTNIFGSVPAGWVGLNIRVTIGAQDDTSYVQLKTSQNGDVYLFLSNGSKPGSPYTKTHLNFKILPNMKHIQ
jgi:hypothetical protein